MQIGKNQLNKNKIYISDLDGTLLRDDETLSDYSKEMLIKLLEAGANLTVASGRSIVSQQQMLKGIPITLPVIEINGSFISNFSTSRHLVINTIKEDMLAEIYKMIKEHNSEAILSAFDGKEDKLYFRDMINDGMHWYHCNRIANKDKRLTYVKDLTSTFDNYIVAFTVINTFEKLKPLVLKIKKLWADKLEMHFFKNPYSPDWWWLTIHDRKSCKSHAVRTLCDYCGFDFKDLVVFGDSLNDVGMFKAAPTAIAVANSSLEIKKLATKIIGSNEEDSVVKYIMDDGKN